MVIDGEILHKDPCRAPSTSFPLSVLFTSSPPPVTCVQANRKIARKSQSQVHNNFSTRVRVGTVCLKSIQRAR